MKTKQIILCTMMVLTSCMAVFLLAPAVMAKDDKPAMLSPSESKFIQEAASAGMAEVKMAELAGKKAEAKDIKAYGMMIAKDHGMANDELKMLAAKKGVLLSEKMNKEKTESYKKLEAAEGMAFDKMFLTAMAKCHETDIQSFKKVSGEAKDAELKMFVDKMLPTLMAHHEKGKELMPK